MKVPAILNWSRKAAPERKPSATPMSPLGAWNRNQRRTVEYANVIAAEKAVEHPVVFRCLHKIAQSVQTVRWYCEADPDVAVVHQASATQIKKINDLLSAPNDTLAPDQLRYWMAMTFALYSRTPFKVGTGLDGVATGIYPLNPAYVQATFDNRGNVVQYKYGSGENTTDVYQTRRAAVASNSNKGWVHEIYTPPLSGNLDTNKNLNVLRSIGLPADVINELLKRAYDTATGAPNTRYIVTTEKSITKSQKEAIVEHIENSAPGGEESGGVLFLYNTEIKVHPLINDLSDIHSKMPLDDMSRMIAGAFGIPISLLGLGAADGAKFAGNYKESRQSFWEDTIIPGYLTPISVGMTLAVCPPGCRIVFDLDSIDAVQDSRTGRAALLEKVGFLTDDEKREMSGFAPLTAEQKAELKERREKPAPVAGNGPQVNNPALEE